MTKRCLRLLTLAAMRLTVALSAALSGGVERRKFPVGALYVSREYREERRLEWYGFGAGVARGGGRGGQGGVRSVDFAPGFASGIGEMPTVRGH